MNNPHENARTTPLGRAEMVRRPVVIGVAAGLAAGALVAAWILRDSAPEERTRHIMIDANDPGRVALGKAVYSAHCASCHGENLEGEPNWRVREADGRLPAPPHDASGHTWHHTDDVLFQLTKYGPAALVGGDYESNMPAYEGTLSNNEILASLAFIKSTWPEDIRSRHDAMNAAMRNQQE